MSLIVLKNITKIFNQNKSNEQIVLKDISFSLPNKGLVAVTGKSGCGKSTLLSIIGLLDNATSGSFYYRNECTDKWNKHRKAQFINQEIGIIFQQYNLIENESVLVNVALPMMIQGKQKSYSLKEASNLISNLGFDQEFGNRIVSTLSGGEKQRVCLLRALINNPSIILCDEPTGALDNKNANIVMNILQKASKKRLVVLVSHNLDLVNKYSDRIITLKNGNIESDTIINNPSNDSCIKKDISNKMIRDDWSKIILENNLKKRKKKNLFSMLAVGISILFSTVIFGFSQSYTAALNQQYSKHLDYGTGTVSIEKSQDVTGGLVSLVKKSRPSLNQIKALEHEYKEVSFCPNYSFLLNSNFSLTYEKLDIYSTTLSPIYSYADSYINKSLLLEGKMPQFNSFYEVVVNKAFANKFKNEFFASCVGKTLTINTNYLQKYYTFDENNAVISDYFEINRDVIISGIVDEISFLSTPTIYYSYIGFEQVIANKKLNNLSDYLGYELSWKDRVIYANDNEDISSYSYYVFINDITKTDVANIYDSVYTFTFNSTIIADAINKIMEAAEVALVVFLFITIIGAILIVGVISYSTYENDRKNSAILSSIGASNDKIHSIYLSENIIVSFIGLLIGLVLSPLCILITNTILNNFIGIERLISMPNTLLLNFNYSYYFIMFIILIFIVILATLVPISFAKHISIKEEMNNND